MQSLLHIVRLSPRVDVYTMQRMEEALYRGDTRSWCLLGGGGAPTPSIVLGVSGVVDQLVHTEEAQR